MMFPPTPIRILALAKAKVNASTAKQLAQLHLETLYREEAKRMALKTWSNI